MIDWTQVPVEGETTAPIKDTGASVLSPLYRERSAFGGQELGGLAGAILGGVVGAPLGPLGAMGGSALGAGLGGAAGESTEQLLRKEPADIGRIGAAGVEEAAWDLGGNLVFKAGGKLVRLAADKIGFSKEQVPDATKAAQEFLQRQGSSLTKPSLYDSPLLQTAENLVISPATRDLFVKKQKEITEALQAGNRDLLASLAKSPEFDMALRQGTSAQRASGQVLQSFIKDGEKALSDAVRPEYQRIFGDTQSRVSMFDVRQWAQRQLSDPASLTNGQKSILRELDTLPPQVPIELLHDIRSRWLAENRDKYSSLGTEKDSRASKTITELVSKLDNAMDASASKILAPKTLADYRKVTRTYREGIQGLQTEAVQEALAKAPEEVGAFLFTSGKETPINELYKSIAAAGKLANKSSKEVIDALRYGYVQAMTNTPENMLRFAQELEQNQATRNTFNVLFDPQQKKAIEAMNEAAKKGLIRPEGSLSGSSRGAAAIYGGLGIGAGLGYAFALSPDQQELLKENLGSAAVSAGALILNQRVVARMLLDPKGAKTLGILSKARDKITSPSAFTKLVVEPLANFYSADPLGDALVNEKPSVNWNTVPTQ